MSLNTLFISVQNIKDRSGLHANVDEKLVLPEICLLYTSPSPRDKRQSRMPSSA